ESLRSQPSITYNNGSIIQTSDLMPNSTIIYSDFNISFNISETLNNRHTYGTTNGLYKKAINVELDAGSIAIETLNKLLENFIQQYSVNSNQNLITNITSRETQDNELSDPDDNQDGIPFDVSTVQDPATKRKRGAPRVKHIKSSLETRNAQSSIKKDKAIRLCSRCKQPNHYAKTCTVDP
ncbi:6614_t:CDS:1, partial [Racocetra persica]